MISLQILAHAMAAQLPCHVQSLVAITALEFGTEQTDIPIDFH